MVQGKVDPEIAALLTPLEKVILVASQSRVAPGGTLSVPNKVYITNYRVLFKDPKWLGLKANIIDIDYKDITSVILRRGVFSTEIRLKSRFSNRQIQLPAVDKNVAQQISLLLQKGIRGQLFTQHDHRVKFDTSDEYKTIILARLEKLVNMREKTLLTEQEFQIMKKELMMTLKPEINYNAANRAKLESLPERKLQSMFVADNPKDALSCQYCNFISIPFGSKFCPQCGKVFEEDTNI